MSNHVNQSTLVYGHAALYVIIGLLLETRSIVPILFVNKERYSLFKSRKPNTANKYIHTYMIHIDTNTSCICTSVRHQNVYGCKLWIRVDELYMRWYDSPDRKWQGQDFCVLLEKEWNHCLNGLTNGGCNIISHYWRSCYWYCDAVDFKF